MFKYILLNNIRFIIQLHVLSAFYVQHLLAVYNKYIDHHAKFMHNHLLLLINMYFELKIAERVNTCETM